MPLERYVHREIFQRWHSPDVDYIQNLLRERIIYWGFPVFLVVSLTLFCLAFQSLFTSINVALILLLPIVYIGFLSGKRAALWTALNSAVVLNFIFIEPRYNFSKPDLIFIVSLSIYLTVAWTIGGMSNKLRRQFLMIRLREKRLETLYEISKIIVGSKPDDLVFDEVVDLVSKSLRIKCGILVYEYGKWQILSKSDEDVALFLSEWELEAAMWSYRQCKESGKGYEAYSNRQGTYNALNVDQNCYGVLVIFQNDDEVIKLEANRNFLVASSNLIATTIHKQRLAKESEQTQMLIESDRLHTAIMNSLSHDLHTPLTAIIGSVSSLIENKSFFTEVDENELLWTIEHEAQRMDRLVKNLLDMTKLEGGILKVNSSWIDINDLIVIVVERFNKIYPTRILKIICEESGVLLYADFALLEQSLTNLLDNAAKYSMRNEPIVLEISVEESNMVLSIHNFSEYAAMIDTERVFDKFYRGKSAGEAVGSGLGLSICKGIIEAHGGTIEMKIIGSNCVEVTVSLPIKPMMKWSEADDGTIGFNN